MIARWAPGSSRCACAQRANAPPPGEDAPREKNVASVVSEPGTRIATRVAVARFPSTIAARPWPLALKNSTCWVRSVASAPASWVLPSPSAVRSADPIACASAAYRADSALAVSAGGAWGRGVGLLGHVAAVVPNTAAAITGTTARLRSFIVASFSPLVRCRIDQHRDQEATDAGGSS